MRFKGSFITLIFAFTVFASGQGLCRYESPTEQDFKDSQKFLEDFVGVPESFQEAMMHSGKRDNLIEYYVAYIMWFVRENGVDQKRLTVEGLEKKKEADLLKAKNMQYTEVLKFDVNMDGQVDIEKEVGSLNKQDSSQDRNKKRDITFLTGLDTDQDGIVSADEMRILNAGKRESTMKWNAHKYEEYLSLDPNDDGVLTIEELEALARKTFFMIDKDQDGIITDEEREPLLKAKRVMKMSRLRRVSEKKCNIPPVPEGVKIMGLSVYEGAAVSTATTIGQDELLDAIEVVVEEGLLDTYLILSSYDPVMWVFKGDTDAIKKVIVNGSHISKVGKSRSGIVGFDKGDVIFSDTSCVPYLTDTGSAEYYLAKNAIKKAVGRLPDYLYGVYDPGRITVKGNGDISSRKVTYVSQEVMDKAAKEYNSPKPYLRDKYRPSTPDGFSDGVWLDIMSFHPAGVLQVDPDWVVSVNKAEAYEILPSFFGIAKLIYEGSIEELKRREYRIIKDIPRYPAGMGSGRAVNFLIAPGVKPPKGSPGQSCVILEETSEILHNKRSCRR